MTFKKTIKLKQPKVNGYPALINSNHGRGTLNRFFVYGAISLGLMAAIFVSLFISYGFYLQTERSLRRTEQEMAVLKRSLHDLQRSAVAAVTFQRQALTEQAKDLTLKEQALTEADHRIGLLQNRLARGQSASALNGTTDSDRPTSLAALAPAVVKLECGRDAAGEQVQRGSGVLYRAQSAAAPFSPFFVRTSLHVVKPVDETPAHCAIILYPDYRDSDLSRLFISQGYKLHYSGADIAYLEPTLIPDYPGAGTGRDLERYALDGPADDFCEPVAIGDPVTVLGYPGSGGETLTITEGIVSGFENFEGAAYLKTSAKIDNGSSGGLAVGRSGCLLGIPTFVQQGHSESIGRILDLSRL